MTAGRVLVADDTRTDRVVLLRALQRLGYDAEGVEDGQQALDRLRGPGTGPGVDAVLLDLLMPVMDGEAALRAITADPALRHLPVLVVSAVEDRAHVLRCIELGATDYLTKPFDVRVLRARLSASLAAKRLRDTELDHLRQVDAVIAAADAVEAGTYDVSIVEGVARRDDALGRLARVVQAMAREVQAREAALRRRVEELSIDIDAARRADQVAEITGSADYRRLREQAQQLRDVLREDDRRRR